MQDISWNTTPQQDTTGSLTGLLDSLTHLLRSEFTAQNLIGQPDSMAHLHQLLQELHIITGTLQIHDLSGQMTDLDQLLKNLTDSFAGSGQSYTLGMGDLHQMLDRLKTLIGHDVPGSTQPNSSSLDVYSDRAGVANPSQPMSQGLDRAAYDLQPMNSLELESGSSHLNLIMAPVELRPKASLDPNSELSWNSPSGQSSGDSLVPTVNPVTHHSPHTAQVMQSCDGVITPDSDNAVTIYDNGAVYWRRGGQICWLNGHEFHNSAGHFGRLASNLKVFDKNDHYIGYVTPNGCAYTPDGHLFARGGTAIWAAAVLLCNTR